MSAAEVKRDILCLFDVDGTLTAPRKVGTQRETKTTTKTFDV
jgi:hypothetical protein